MENVYFISGLGADKRIFQFLDLSFCNPLFVEWINPFPAEDIGSYAVRLKEQITTADPIIVGVSFGGMVAIEIAKRFPVKKVVLLSSAKTEKEIPFYLKLMRYVPLHKIFPPRMLRSANQFAYRLMGTAKRRDKIIFTGMMKEADDRFVSWAIDQVIHWKNNTIIPGTVHIHGTADVLLPYRFVKADHSIKGGEHLMLILKADRISKLLKEIINPD